MFADPPDKAALARLADDAGNEGRIRALAYNLLRKLGATPPSKKLLGRIVEVPLAKGLDVLAAFSDGGIRSSINPARWPSSKGNKIPSRNWRWTCWPPSESGKVRISFPVSDDFYFGEGPFSVMQSDDMAGPVLAMAARMLKQVCESRAG